MTGTTNGKTHGATSFKSLPFAAIYNNASERCPITVFVAFPIWYQMLP